MIPDIPWYITAIVLSVNVAIAVAVWRIVAGATTSRKVCIGSAIFLFGWLGATLLLAPAPGSLASRDAFYITPLIPAFALGPKIVLLAALGSPRRFAARWERCRSPRCTASSSTG